MVFCTQRLGDFFVPRGWAIFLVEGLRDFLLLLERLCDFYCPERLHDFSCPRRLGDFLVPRGCMIYFGPKRLRNVFFGPKRLRDYLFVPRGCVIIFVRRGFCDFFYPKRLCGFPPKRLRNFFFVLRGCVIFFVPRGCMILLS